MKTALTLAAVPLGIALVYGAAQHYAPGYAAEMRSWTKAGQEWSEQAIQSDPTGYLESTRTRLAAERGRLRELVRELRASIGPLDGHIAERTSDLARTEAFLSEGRAIYQKAAAGDPDGSINFAGRHYPDLPTFKAQLELLFSEKASNEQLLDQVRATRKRLGDRLAVMLLQAGKLDTAIQEIGPQIAIVRAERSAADMEHTLSVGRRLSEGVLLDTSRMIDEFPIATTRELLRSAPTVIARPVGNNPAFDAFLRSEG